MSALEAIRGVLFDFLDKTNVIVTSLTVLTILYTRSAGILYFAAGAVVCARTVKFVKRFIRQPRPINPLPGRQRTSYGMPSTHSAVITYYAAYSIAAAKYLPVHYSLPSESIVRPAVPLIVIPWAAAVAISRTLLGHHTWPQVGAGCLHGLIITYMWFNIWVRGANERGRIFEETYMQVARA